MHRIPVHCEITHSWHSRLVTKNKGALYLNWTILICKHGLQIHSHFHLHRATLIFLTAWIFACAKFCLASMFKSLSDIVNAYHANYRTSKNTCDSSQTEKPPLCRALHTDTKATGGHISCFLGSCGPCRQSRQFYGGS